MIILLSFCIFSGLNAKVLGPEEALDLFEKATIAWINNDTFQALEYMKLAMEGEIYLEDIPEFWYMLSRIELELGMIEEAKESLMNVLILDPSRSEIITLLNTIDIFENSPTTKNNFSYISSFKNFEGFSKGYEYFYSPVSVELYDGTLIILDSINSRLVFIKKGSYTAYKLPVERPNSFKIDSTIHMLYYSDTKEGTIRKFNLSEFKDEGVFANGFSYPVVCDIDQAGRLLIHDVGTGKLCVVSPFGEKLMEFPLDQKYGVSFVNGAVFHFEKIYVQDLSDRSYRVFNTLSGKETDKLPFPDIDSIPITFDVDGQGGIISLWSDGKFRYITSSSEMSEIPVDFDTSGINYLDYSPPFLICSDIKKHRVYEFLLNTEKPNYIVSIFSYKMNQNSITVDFLFETLFGGYRITEISPFLYVYDSKGRVGFDYTQFKKEANVLKIKNSEKFFGEIINTLERGNKNYVIFMDKTDSFNFTNVMIQSKLKDITYYLLTDDMNDIDKTFLTLVHSTGGIAIKKDYLKDLERYLSMACPLTSRVRYNYDFSIRKIRSISVQLNIGDHTYSDTVYYVGGLKIEGGSE